MRLFTVHVQHLLCAFLDKELPEGKRRRVAAHLETCARCRSDYETIRQAHRAISHLPLVNAPDSLWSRVETELHQARAIDGTSPPTPLRNGEGRKSADDGGHRRVSVHGAEGRDPIGWNFHTVWSFQDVRAFVMKRPLAVAGVILLCIVSMSLGIMYGKWQYRSNHPAPLIPDGPSWSVARLSGTPRIGAAGVSQTGRLRVGEWLHTDSASQAEITVADIGKVRVEPNSRVRLEETGKSVHRLELAQGELSARVLAPPRLFMVDTQAARAVDLGCAYTLRVDKAGITYLLVTSGRVVLEDKKGREAIVPAGATCETRPNTGPGTPCFTDAPEVMKAALVKYDFENGGEPQLQIVLKSARPLDTLPLWHLLTRVSVQDRGRVFDRLAQIAPPPAGVTRPGVLNLNRKMLALWKDQIEPNWGMAIPEGYDSLLYSDPMKP